MNKQPVQLMQWKSFKEDGFPPTENSYLIFNYWFGVFKCILNKDTNQWVCMNGSFAQEDCTHWMEMPEWPL